MSATTPYAPDPQGFIRIPVRRTPWHTALLFVGGGLLVAANAAALLSFLTNGIRALADHRFAEATTELVFAVLLAAPLCFFIWLGVIMIKAGRSRLNLRVGPTGLALTDGRLLQWDRVRSVSISGAGGRAALVVRAAPVTDTERLLSRGDSFQWCRIRLRRLRMDQQQLTSLLRRLAPEPQRSQILN